MRDPEEGDGLPEGVTREMLDALVIRVAEELEKIGLYADGDVHVEGHGEHLAFVGNFRIGDIAFTQRVQNPTQDAFDDQFRAIETDNLYEQADDIRNEFRRDDAGGDDA